MDSTAIATTILTLFAGIGVFLVACKMMSSSLETAGSRKLRRLFEKTSKNKLIGVGIGAGTTAAIQSSGATTVMVIGFVNAGIMTLTTAATIIFGANIGTTITGHIVALGMFGGNSISTTVIFSAFAGAGAFISAFSKRPRLKLIGDILAGFGMLFVGLSIMSGSMEKFAELEGVRLFLAGIDNAVLLVIIGALLTAIIQSSSVMTSIAITMVVTGLITLDQGIFLTMGSNIGSCVVALVAGMTSSKNAKRASLIHLFFNIGGVILFMIIGLIIKLVSGGAVTLGTIFETLFPNVPQTQLAMFHTVFNVVAVVVALPLTGKLVSLVTKLVPDRSGDEEGSSEPKLYFIDDDMLTTPPIAVAQVKKEIINMGEISMKNFNTSLDIISSLDLSPVEKFYENERELDYLNSEIVRFLIKCSNLKLSNRDREFVGAAFHVVSDFERVGDYAKNIIEYAEALKESGESFSEDALAEITELRSLTSELFKEVMTAYRNNDSAAADRAQVIEDKVDDITNAMARNHIRRMNEGICTPSAGANYLSLASNSERVADHFINVAESIV